MLTCLGGALDFGLGGSLTEASVKSEGAATDGKVFDLRKRFLSFAQV